MRLSKSFLKTYKEAPAVAEVISHKLMLRAGMIKQLSRGVYSYMPMAYLVLRKIENITREEMNRAGAQEILMPIIQPADLWKESGRFFNYGKELMRLKDRNDRDFVLGPTHEEVVSDIVRNTISSYKDLPFNLYQIQTKFRDEVRPRFGLMRGREFIMKDAYSFHIDELDLDREYNNMKDAYSRILNRCGLKFRAVEADTGSIGGAASHEFMVLADSGEDDILYSTTGDYAANVEKAVSIIDYEISDEEEKEIQEISTPNIKTIEDLANFLNISKEKTVKAVLYKEVLENNTNYYIALIRGDLDINEIKLKNSVNSNVEFELMDENDILKFNLESGFVGAIKNDERLKDIVVIADESVKYLKNFVIGANKKDYHYINANLKDLKIDKFFDIRTAKENEKSIDGGILEIAKGIEVGHIFKLGTKYSEALNVKILDQNGKQKIVYMGCYGIGISRIMAAAIEQNNDENGIIWPLSIAPYHIIVIPANMKDEKQVEIAEKLYLEIKEKYGLDVLLDDRQEKAGFKFKDADLLGIPYRIVIGKDIENNNIEFVERKGLLKEIINIDEIDSKLKMIKDKLNNN